MEISLKIEQNFFFYKTGVYKYLKRRRRRRRNITATTNFGSFQRHVSALCNESKRSAKLVIRRGMSMVVGGGGGVIRFFFLVRFSIRA